MKIGEVLEYRSVTDPSGKVVIEEGNSRLVDLCTRTEGVPGCCCYRAGDCIV